MSYSKAIHSLEELIGCRVVCDHSHGHTYEAECVGVDRPMIKLRHDSGGEGWFSMTSFYCIRKADPLGLYS